jgi:hypothetical protein
MPLRGLYQKGDESAGLVLGDIVDDRRQVVIEGILLITTYF